MPLANNIPPHYVHFFPIFFLMWTNTDVSTLNKLLFSKEFRQLPISGVEMPRAARHGHTLDGPQETTTRMLPRPESTGPQQHSPPSILWCCGKPRHTNGTHSSQTRASTGLQCKSGGPFHATCSMLSEKAAKALYSTHRGLLHSNEWAPLENTFKH